MSAPVKLQFATGTLHVSTLMVHIRAPVTMDTLEMASHAEV